MLFSAEQAAKGFVPICSTESGIVMRVRESHKENAQSPMEVTELGMLMLVRESHKENAQSPMKVTESGMVTWVRNLQS